MGTANHHLDQSSDNRKANNFQIKNRKGTGFVVSFKIYFNHFVFHIKKIYTFVPCLVTATICGGGFQTLRRV